MSEGPPFRKKCKRLEIPFCAHELTFSCYGNQPFLVDERTLGWLVDAVSRAKEKHGFDLWAWVFMPWHVHLLIWFGRETYSVSDVLKSIKQPVARKEIGFARANDLVRLRLMSAGQSTVIHRFWQRGGGYDRNLTSPEAVRASLEYIHANPVKAGLVEHAQDWRWSSAADWMGKGRGPLEIDRESFPI